MVTLDNASNNNTMMEEVTDELRVLNIPFDIVGNRIRCVLQQKSFITILT